MALKTIPARPVAGNNITTEYGQWVFDLLNNQYDISNQAGRKMFVDNAENNTKYILYNGTEVYDVWTSSVITSTQVNIEGKRFWTDNIGSRAPEHIIGIITEGGTNTTGARVYAGAFKVLEAKLPANVEELELPSTLTVEQMILDNNGNIVKEENDPTWSDVPGTQTLTFNPSQITISISSSGITVGQQKQFLLGSSSGNLVLDASVEVYSNASDASKNASVAGNYKWYAYISGSNFIFTMDDSGGSFTNTNQTLYKMRDITKNAGQFKGHYTSQASILQKSTWLGDLTKGSSLTVTLPTGITIDTMTEIGLSVSGTTDWTDTRYWDRVTPQYCNVTTEDTSNTWWIEYKVEAVPGDKTKLKVTNFASGNQNNTTQAYRAHWIQFKGGR